MRPENSFFKKMLTFFFHIKSGQKNKSFLQDSKIQWHLKYFLIAFETQTDVPSKICTENPTLASYFLVSLLFWTNGQTACQ